MKILIEILYIASVKFAFSLAIDQIIGITPWIDRRLVPGTGVSCGFFLISAVMDHSFKVLTV